MYDELIAELRQHHCDAKEDDTQEVCDECAYDVIIVDKSAPSGIASVCVCGLMNRAADAIEELSGFVQEAERDRDEYRERLDKANELMQKRWIPVTERLPEERQFVLAWKDEKPKGFICISCWMVDAGWAFKKITHWMPLPKPPEEESV